MSTAGKCSYAPRNALNADVLKAGIAVRSQARDDDPAVRDWLLNHFYRHVVANFQPVRSISSLEEAREVLGNAPVPAWVMARFKAPHTSLSNEREASVAPLVWVSPTEPTLLALETRLVEFLQSRRGTALQGKLERINCPQAIALWKREHEEMATRIERGWRLSQPDALRKLLATPNGCVVEFLANSAMLRSEMAFESYVMRHCLGQFANRQTLCGGYGEHYAEAIAQGRLRLLSFRDRSGQPHITISSVVQADGSLTVDQVKGKQNRPPAERYVDDLLVCLNALVTDGQTPDDCLTIGVVRTPTQWCRIEDITDALTQTQLAARYPRLFPRLKQPAPMVEWLVAGRQKELMGVRRPQSPAVAYAVRNIIGGSSAPLTEQKSAAFATEGVLWPGFDGVRGQGKREATT